MNKTKIGITIGLAGAAVYFLGLYSSVLAFLFVVYILAFEENGWLKKQAVKMAALILGFAILQTGLGCVDKIVSIINYILRWFPVSWQVSVPLNLTSLLSTALSLTEDILLIVMGWSAWRFQSVNIRFLDNIVDKNL